jgi:hypothetical protein
VRRPAPRVAAALAAALALHVAAPGGALGGEPVEPYAVEGKRVVVWSTVPARVAAERCRDALEAAIPVYESHLPYRMPEGEKVVLHLYATAAEYEKAVTDGGAKWLAKNQAATLAKTKECHLVCQPRSDERYLALVGGLPEMTRFLACHEGVHQFLRRAGAPAIDHWPAWYAEGMADHLAEECRPSGGAKAAPPTLYAADRFHWVADARSRGAALSLERTLFAAPEAFSSTISLYAHTHDLYRHLAADAGRMRRLHEAIRGLGAPGEPGDGARDDRGERHARACARALADVYGPLDAVEGAWAKGTHRPSTAWFQAGRACERVGDAIVCAGFPDSNALLVSAEPPPGRPFALSCDVEVADLGDRQADVVLAFEDRRDARFLKVALGSAGFVTLLAFADGYWQGRYRRGADVPPETFAAGVAVPVRVHVARDAVRVEARGKTLLEAPVPPGFDVLRGAWGLGATDSAARFRRVEVAPAR